MRKNHNKGFSLVELIVVVLIMAIIAVVLAPQVTKWVQTSRESSDLQTLDSAASFSQMALTNADAYDESMGETIRVNIGDDKTVIASDSGSDIDTFVEKFAEYAGVPASDVKSIGGNAYEIKSITTKSGKPVEVVIENGIVATSHEITNDDLEVEATETKPGVVNPGDGKSISINKKTLSLTVGQTDDSLSVTLSGMAEGTTASWSSDKTGVATVAASAGKVTVTAVAPGKAKITATADGKSISCTVTVQAAGTPETPETPKSYTVTYDANGGTGSVAPATTDNSGKFTVAAGTGLSKKNSTFAGWKTAADGSGASYAVDNEYTITGNITLYAQWTSNGQYTVSFDVEGIESITKDKDEDVTLPATIPTKAHYTFLNWSDGTNTYAAGAKYTARTTVTLVAQWKEMDKYTVSFDLDNGSGTFNAISAYVDEDVTLPDTVPTKLHKDFDGWKVSQGTKLSAGAKYTGRTDITLKATWKDMGKYTVKFELNGGSGTGFGNIEKYLDENATLPSTAPKKSGYTFDGWSDGTKTYAAGAQYDGRKNVTLKAQWKAEEGKYGFNKEITESNYVGQGTYHSGPSNKTFYIVYDRDLIDLSKLQWGKDYYYGVDCGDYYLLYKMNKGMYGANWTYIDWYYYKGF